MTFMFLTLILYLGIHLVDLRFSGCKDQSLGTPIRKQSLGTPIRVSGLTLNSLDSIDFS